jgi:hypothetical protein
MSPGGSSFGSCFEGLRFPPQKNGDLSLTGLMAGLRINDQKNAIAVTMIIATAFKICISHRKMAGLLNRLPTKVSFSIF